MSSHRSCIFIRLLCRSALHLLSALVLRSQLSRLIGLLRRSGLNPKGLLRPQLNLGLLLLSGLNFNGLRCLSLLILKVLLQRSGLNIRGDLRRGEFSLILSGVLRRNEFPL